ncbi:MAG: hypothetical protein V4476_18520 [Pseudomonadota bacterium]
MLAWFTRWKTPNMVLTMLKLVFLVMIAVFPSFGAAQEQPSAADIAKIEQTMAKWLAHPMEYGVAPKRIKYFATVRAKLPDEGASTDVQIVEYEMPDGTYGRGLVNPLTWSFLGSVPYDALGNEGLVTAYAGWLWLFPALNDGRATIVFEPTTLQRLLKQLAREGITDVTVVSQYKVKTSELFEFEGVRNGVKIRGAGSAGSKLIFDATAPQASLPVVYTYLAKVIRGEI